MLPPTRSLDAPSCRGSTRRSAIVTLRPLDLATDLVRLFAISSGAPAAIGPRRVDVYDPGERVCPT
jgi:hypothetical protein